MDTAQPVSFTKSSNVENTHFLTVKWNNFVDYITRIIVALVDETNESKIRQPLTDASTAIETFINNPDSAVFVVNRLSRENKSDKEHSFAVYTSNDSVSCSKKLNLAIIFIKKGLVILANKPICDQINVTILNSSDPFDTIQSHIGNVLAPYFDSITRDKFFEKEESEKLISSIENNLNEVAAALLQLKDHDNASDCFYESTDQNLDIQEDAEYERMNTSGVDECDENLSVTSKILDDNVDVLSASTADNGIDSHNGESSLSSSEEEYFEEDLEKVYSRPDLKGLVDNDGDTSLRSSRLKSLRSAKSQKCMASTSKKRAFIDESEGSDTNGNEKPLAVDPLKTVRKVRKVVIDSDEDDEIQIINEVKPSTSKFSAQRKQKSTIVAEQEERERVKRLAEKQKLFNRVIFDSTTTDIDTALNESFHSQKAVKALILDSNPKCSVKVHPSLVRFLKPHQLSGVQFLYDCTIESVDRLDTPGGGGILAHCMGLGKTLQTITFLHTILTNPLVYKTIKRVLIVCPKNVILNWNREFEKWIFENDPTMPEILVVELDTPKDNKRRLADLKVWFESKSPTVALIGYEMYRNLTQDYTKPNKSGKIAAETTKKKFMPMQPEFRKYLQDPGPDMVICDEGHKLKNIDAELSKAISRMRTKRRVCLTGTPMQNNLIEYHCMVNFVKENLLGSKKEFQMRFEGPIKKGQTADADEYDVKLMRRRCHVLYTKLKNVVDRRDFSVLKDSLLPKLEYVITVRLTEKQIQLYQKYLDVECANFEDRRRRLLADYYVFSRIFTHPFQLVFHQETKNDRDSDEMVDFIVNGSESDASEYNRERNRDNDYDADSGRQTPQGWFEDSGILSEEDRHDYTLSYKLLFLIEIIKQCETIGDKMLVFSQSLETLRLICRMLEDMEDTWFDDGHEAVAKRSSQKWGWQRNVDYMIITGKVSSKDREIIQRNFNSQNAPQTRLCLISTKAGSLGTNFVAANRVIIFDQHWNPSNDRQALFRAYRFGQTKPTYIYRLVAYGTIEDRIYARQVTKESISARVVDENQIRRHFLNADLEALYRLQLDDYNPSKPPLYSVPEDTLLANVFSRLKEGIVNCLQHDSLLEHVEDEVLTAEERQQAWEEYDRRFNPRIEGLQPSENNCDSDEIEIIGETGGANSRIQAIYNSLMQSGIYLH